MRNFSPGDHSLATGAFAPVSSVTIFGIIDVAIESGKYSDAAGNLTRVVSGANNTNRIGFRGTEDLGGSMNANFRKPNPFRTTVRLRPQRSSGTAVPPLVSRARAGAA